MKAAELYAEANAAMVFAVFLRAYNSPLLKPEPIEKLAVDLWKRADAQRTVERLQNIRNQMETV